MKFITWNRLHKDIVALASEIPGDVVGVVGVPRSGLVVAGAMALHLHVPFASLDRYCEGRSFYGAGRRLAGEAPVGGRVLLIDDTAWSGRSMDAAVKRMLEAGIARDRFIAAVVYGTAKSTTSVDMVRCNVEGRRLFEWNIWNHGMMSEHVLFDLDGVLCLDPPHDDDGERYAKYIRHARRLYRPKKVRGIVTCRLEKWRKMTAGWLQRAGVEYGSLRMMDYETAAERRKAARNGRWKGTIYKRDAEASLFIESSLTQARQIRQIAGKPVLCTETMVML